VEFCVLGRISVVADGSERELGSTREAALLADLIVHAGEVVPASRLIDDLWRGEPPRSAAGTLQTYVKNLRRMLEPSRPSRVPSVVLVSRRPGYVLNVEAGGLDAWRCERLIDEGRAALAGDDPELAVERLGCALALWRGPAYGDLASESYVQSEAARLEELRLVAIEDRVQADLAAHARALAEDARAQLRVDSRQEPVETTLFADMRYVGQSHETPVSYAVGETWEQLRRRYDELHAQRNGFARPDDDVEVVTVRAEALGTSALGIADLPPFVQSDEAPRRGSRSVTTPTGPVPADVWWRPAIPVGTGIEGPAVIEEGEATTYLGVGETAVVHPTGALEIRWPT